MAFGRRRFRMSWLRLLFQPVSATLLVLLCVSLTAAVGIQHTHTHKNRHAHVHTHGHSHNSPSTASGSHLPPGDGGHGDTVPGDGSLFRKKKQPRTKGGSSGITIARSEGKFNNSQVAVNKYVSPMIEEGEADHVREIYDDIMKYRSTLRAIEERKHQRAEIGVAKYFQHIKQELYARDHVQDLMEAAAVKCTEHLQQFFELQQQFDHHTEVARQLESNATWVLNKYARDADADPHRVSDLSSQKRVLHDHRVSMKAPTIAALEEVKDHCGQASPTDKIDSGDNSDTDANDIADTEHERQDDSASTTGDGNEGSDDKGDLDDQGFRTTTPSGQRVYNRRGTNDNASDDADGDDGDGANGNVDDSNDDANIHANASKDQRSGLHVRAGRRTKGVAHKIKTSSDGALVSQLQKQLVDQMAVSAQLKELVALLVKLVQTAAVPGSARPVASQKPILAAPPTAAATGRHSEHKCQADIRKILLHHHFGQYVANSRLLRAVYRGFTKLAGFSEDDSKLLQEHFEEEAAARSGGSHDACRTKQFERALEAHMEKLEVETRRGFERLGQELPTPNTRASENDDAPSIVRVVHQSTRQLHHEMKLHMQGSPNDQSSPIQILNDAISPLSNKSTSGRDSQYVVGISGVNGGEAAFVSQIQQFTNALQLEALRLARQFWGNSSQSTTLVSTTVDDIPPTKVAMSGHNNDSDTVDDSDEQDSEYSTTDMPGTGDQASQDAGVDGDTDLESRDGLSPFETTAAAEAGVLARMENDDDGRDGGDDDDSNSSDGLDSLSSPASGTATGQAVAAHGIQPSNDTDDDSESPDGLAPYETTSVPGAADTINAGVAAGHAGHMSGDRNVEVSPIPPYETTPALSASGGDDDGDESPDGLAPYETTSAAGAADGSQSGIVVGAVSESNDDGDENPDGLAPYETTSAAGAPSMPQSVTGIGAASESDEDGDESPDGLASYETTLAAGTSGVAPGVVVGQEARVVDDDDENPDGFAAYETTTMPFQKEKTRVGSVQDGSAASPRNGGSGSSQNVMSGTAQQQVGGAGSIVQRIPTAQATRSGPLISMQNSGVVNVAAKAAAQVVAEMSPGSKRRSGKSRSKLKSGRNTKALADAAGAAAAAMAASESAPEISLPRFQEHLMSSSSTQSTSHQTLTNIEKLRAARERLAKTVALADP